MNRYVQCVSVPVSFDLRLTSIEWSSVEMNVVTVLHVDCLPTCSRYIQGMLRSHQKLPAATIFEYLKLFVFAVLPVDAAASWAMNCEDVMRVAGRSLLCM